MDLSNLSSDLPPTKQVGQASVSEVNEELRTNFRNAAKSVASLYNSGVGGAGSSSKNKTEFTEAAKSIAALYRITNNSSSMVHQTGYLRCLDDILKLIAGGEDVENWVLTKRAEILNANKNGHNGGCSLHGETTPPNTQIENCMENNSSDPAEDFHIPSDFAFSFALESQPSYHFRPGIPPLSVTHSHKQRNNLKRLKKSDHLLWLKMQQQQQDQQQQQQQPLQLQYTGTGVSGKVNTSDDSDTDVREFEVKDDSLEDLPVKKRKVDLRKSNPG